MPEAERSNGELVREIRTLVEQEQIEPGPALRLTLRALANLITRVETHTHPELKEVRSLRKWAAGVATVILLGALGFVWGIATDQVIVTFAP